MSPENQEMKVPDRYAKLGGKQGFNPTPVGQLKMIVEAEAGHGKTTFLMSIPELCVFDHEASCGNAVRSQATYFSVKTWNEYEALKGLLLDDSAASKPAFTRVAFDTADSFLSLLDAHMLEGINAAREKKGYSLLSTILEYGEGGAGYSKLYMAALRELSIFEKAGYPFLLSDHLRVRKHVVGDNVYTERRCAMAPSIMEVLLKSVDVKARITRSLDVRATKATKDIKVGDKVKTIETTTGEKTMDDRYWLSLMPTDTTDDANDTKRRIPKLQGVVQLPLAGGYDAFSKMYNDAVEAARKM